MPSSNTETPQPDPAPAARAAGRRGTVALALAGLATLLFVLLRSTLAGTSPLAASIADGDTGHRMIAMGGFVLAVGTSIVAVLVAVRAIAEDRGRRRGIAAVILALGSPMAAVALTAFPG
ncbi:hypothetical protein DNL40_10525 [Xylanimonas oleitrophica]|uniref:Uncharacterized protein n=1 Tax=Xylanimonas oleitrophica TaxID=2607479 RepID=A0A2W5YEF7_9MICO|nr:hypothetical protein [Xylanimonas oleitrophica]PZR52791.1 hypothetical protein DNL40_10525 [Xylanimonas oleitrophica]